MNVFDLDHSIIGDYERFARSFTQIRAEDIRTQVDALYATGRFWPEPLISINPHYERDASVETLVEEGFLHPDTAKIFRVGGSADHFVSASGTGCRQGVQRQQFCRHDGNGLWKVSLFLHPDHRRSRESASGWRKTAYSGHHCVPDECPGEQPDAGTPEVRRTG